MAKKVPAIELDLIHPHNTRKRKFGCEHCDIKYTLKHYRILYEAKKISYFSLREKPKYVVCHQCLYKLADKFKNKLKIKIILLKLNVEDEEVLIRI